MLTWANRLNEGLSALVEVMNGQDNLVEEKLECIKDRSFSVY